MMPPLQKQIVEFPFGFGLDTKADSKVVKPPKLAGLENARLINNETVNKRYGTSAIGPNGTNSRVLSKLWLTADGDVLGVFASLPNGGVSVGDYIARYNTSIGAWGFVGASPLPSDSITSLQRFHQSCIPAVQDVIRNQYQQSTPDAATLNGLTCYVWEENGTTFYSVVNRTTGVTELLPTYLANSGGTGTRPRVLVVNGLFLVGYWDGTNIKVSSLNSDLSLSAATSFVSPSGLWDWSAVGNNYCIVRQFTGSIVNAVCTTTAGANVFSTTVASENPDNALAIAVPQSATDPVRVFWHNNTNGLRAAVLNTSGTVTTAAYTLDASTSPVVQNIAAINGQSQNTHFWCFAEVNNATSYNTLIKCFHYATDGVALPGSKILRGVGLASKPVMRQTGTPSLLVTYSSSLQSTYFLCDVADVQLGSGTTNLEVRARLLSTVAGGLTSRPMLPNLMFVDSPAKTLSCVGLRKNKVVSLGSSLTSINGVSEFTFQFSSSTDDWANKGTAALFDNLLVFCGGQLAAYDGVYLLEQGFFVYPETPTAVASTSGGALADGTYTFAQTYEYTDYQGNVVESTPSVSGTVVISGGGGAGKITFTAPTYRIGLGQRQGNTVVPRRVSVALWLSDANTPNTLYRATDPVSLSINDHTVDSLTLVVTTSNASLVGRQALYTTGGVLPNFTPDGPSCMATFGKNLVIDDPNDPTILRYSKLDTQKYGPHFASQFTIPVFADGGRPLALISMDGRLIIFKKRQIWYCYGSGLDDLGGGQGFSVPQKLRDDIGCVGPQLLCEIPQGILFNSSKGIWLLRRDMSVTYAGAAVETYNSNTIRSFTHVKDQNEVRILLNDGATTLVYNYYWVDDQGVGQWWTNTSYSGNSAIVDSNGVYTFAHLTANGFAYAYKENQSGFVDNHITAAPFITEKITTGWYALAGKQGYQRVFSILLLGLLRDAHTLKVEIAYDYETSFSETHTITSANLTSNGSNYQGRIFPTRQRCQAIQLRISDTSQSGTGESLTLTGVAFEIGALPGAMRLPAAKSG